MKQDLMLAIIRAHYLGSHRHMMRSLVLQAAAKIKNEQTKAELLKLANAGVDLPHNVQGMVKANQAVNRADLVLSPAIVAEANALVAEHQARELLASHGLRPRSRILFHGPPGCGKTSLASALAAEICEVAYSASLPAIIGSYLGESSKHLAALLGALREGMAIVLDELDSIGAVRASDGSSAGKEQSYTLNTFLVELDRNREGVLFVTTNRLDMIDPALARRFDSVVEFKAPSDSEKFELVGKLAERYGVDIAGRFEWESLESLDAVAKAAERCARERVLGEHRKAAE